jgi:hypothetical protein
MLVVGVFSTVSAPQLAWFALASFAILLAVFSGFVGAFYSRSAPLFNGSLAGFIGGSLLLVGLAVLAPAGIGMVFVGPLLITTFLAFLGALIAVYAWPRRGF